MNCTIAQAIFRIYNIVKKLTFHKLHSLCQVAKMVVLFVHLYCNGETIFNEAV